MRALVVGGAASGKSAWAERLACSLGPKRSYAATMRNVGSEAQERIERHQRQRAEGNFRTIECPHSLAPAINAAPGGVILVDDLGNLVANGLFPEDGSMADPGELLARLVDEFEQLSASYEHVVVVGNLVGCEGRWRQTGTDSWVRLVSSLCSELAARSDLVVELVAGIAHPVKGTLI